ncbi:anti-sigma factor family protein [Sphingomonas sp. SRS2]|uniref:anti-sigma factor family protein n=1 Tax=Sphingomonas sp. SRS2 TaxID=133190 RepID=UPI00061845D7|nr:anti-sigma factor [Sphingomonas sp. SRS2]KKC24714.1 anti-sigma factor [Sphingomonas sp. SRS2]
MRPETITEAEIHAYLDGELELSRRYAVENHLAGHPADAARFMADLRLRTSLRMIANEAGEPPHSMVEAAARLGTRLNERPAWGFRMFRSGPVMRSLAAAAMLVLILIPARNVLASPPDFIGDAVDAYRTGLLRARMASQIESPHFDAREVQRTTHIRLPRLPARWVVTDAQIFPSEKGPALQLMVSTPTDEKMSIFAVRASTDSPEEPTTVRHEGTSVAYWREGDMSYALTGDEAPEAVDSVADDIAADQS